jgi:dGTP triphosphohydrolase
MAENDHVRTRLSHSLEVASAGQTLGSIIGSMAVIMHRIWVDGTEFRWTKQEAAAA